MSKTRIDVYMVEKGFAPSRNKAQELINAGLVSVRENVNVKAIKNPSELIDELSSPEILIQKNPFDRYVSRGGIKLERALMHVSLPVDGLKILDVGISTGGFSDCLLQNGAAFILGVDVGHNQLSLKLKNDPRIQSIEGVNAREIHQDEKVKKMMPEGGFDMAVIDVSFISLKLILPSVFKLINQSGRILALVKPQFEVGPEGLGKNGIVKDLRLYEQVKASIESCVYENGKKVISYFESELEGKDGNKEFFIFIS